MIPFFARRFQGAIVALALIALMAAASAAPNRPRQRLRPRSIRRRCKFAVAAGATIQQAPGLATSRKSSARAIRKSPSASRGPMRPFLEIAKGLAAGKLEVALLAGPSHPPNGAELPAKDAQRRRAPRSAHAIQVRVQRHPPPRDGRRGTPAKPAPGNRAGPGRATSGYRDRYRRLEWLRSAPASLLENPRPGRPAHPDRDRPADRRFRCRLRRAALWEVLRSVLLCRQSAGANRK